MHLRTILLPVLLLTPSVLAQEAERSRTQGDALDGGARVRAESGEIFRRATGSCSAQYGAGNVVCGSRGCYNPSNGESCCSDGTYCPSGRSCAAGGCVLNGSRSGAMAVTAKGTNAVASFFVALLYTLI